MSKLQISALLIPSHPFRRDDNRSKDHEMFITGKEARGGTIDAHHIAQTMCATMQRMEGGLKSPQKEGMGANTPEERAQRGYKEREVLKGSEFPPQGTGEEVGGLDPFDVSLGTPLHRPPWL